MLIDSFANFTTWRSFKGVLFLGNNKFVIWLNTLWYFAKIWFVFGLPFLFIECDFSKIFAIYKLAEVWMKFTHVLTFFASINQMVELYRIRVRIVSKRFRSVLKRRNYSKAFIDLWWYYIPALSILWCTWLWNAWHFNYLLKYRFEFVQTFLFFRSWICVLPSCDRWFFLFLKTEVILVMITR